MKPGAIILGIIVGYALAYFGIQGNPPVTIRTEPESKWCIHGEYASYQEYEQTSRQSHVFIKNMGTKAIRVYVPCH